MPDNMTPAAIVDDAIARTGVSDLGDDWFLGPLAAWSEDLTQRNLNDFGRRFMRSLAVSDVSRRLAVLDTIRNNPEILEVKIPPIVYITGLERSGTTILHNLLALHPQLRPLLRWELMEPIPPPTTATYKSDPRIAAVQTSIEPLRGSLLEHMHWVDADQPEECVWGFIDCVGMLGQAASFCMPQWSDFIRNSDLTPAFQHYRSVLQLLTWQHPPAANERLVLKAPQISGQVDSFAGVFPEAEFVVTDRDPFRSLVSVMVMVANIIDPFCVENPAGSAAVLDATVDFFGARLSSISDFTDAHPDRITHMSYPALATDATPTVLGFLDQLGLATDAELERRIDEHLQAQRAGSRAAPPTTLEVPGLNHDSIGAVPAIDAYCSRFGIEAERERLTGR
jgi:hypothetical protein